MRGILWFLLICFGLAWIWWELIIQSGIGVLSWQFQLYGLPAAFSPAVAAIVVRKWITGEGFGDAGLRLNLRHWRFYLLAWLIPLVLVAAITLEAVLFGIAEPDFTLARASAAGVAGRSSIPLGEQAWIIVPQLLVVALIATPLFWGEEFGWRGYLQPRIFPGRPVLAAVATGVIWAVWHYPVTLRGYNYPDHPILGSLVFIPVTISLSYLFDWIRRRTGTIWTASLAHSATNSTGGLAAIWFAGAASPVIVGFGGLLAIPPLFMACACVFLFGDRQARQIGADAAKPQ